MAEFISGIQQIGIGVENAVESMHHYAKLLGMKTLLFNDVSEAKLMTKYTGGKIYKRNALLTLNMLGGGGLELWQFMDRQPYQPIHEYKYGDIGIYAAKIKSTDVLKAHAYFTSQINLKVSALSKDGKGDEQFYVIDHYRNVFNIVNSNQWFQKKDQIIGGVTGAVIGVSNMEKAISFYKDLLNINAVKNDITESLDVDGTGIKEKYRKVLLQKDASPKGAFSKLLGPVEIELVQSLDRQPKTIYQDRFWGDCGFIHLCFDVFNMDGLKYFLGSKGYFFTVDSLNSFTMENSTGRFAYVEDPDQTLIELVEIHSVPVFKKIGIFLKLHKRNRENPLPDWMIKLLSLSRVR